MRRNNRKVTELVAEHSNADSLTHNEDKARNDVLHAQKVKASDLAENIVKTAELILLRSGLGYKYKSSDCPNQFLTLQNGSLSPAMGDDYSTFLVVESKKRKRYRPDPKSKPSKIGKDSSLNICTYTLLPAHSLFIRTLAREKQMEFILDMARKRAAQLEALTGWKVLGIAVHNDTEVLHFDLMITRYSEPVPPLLNSRQRVPACELLGDRRGIRSVGPCVCGYYRLAAEEQFDCIRPGLEKDAIYKLGAHRREYDGENPVDWEIVLAIDKEIRTEFGGITEFEAIRSEWYVWQAQIIRERAVKPLRNLLEQDKLAEKLPGAASALYGLLGAYEERGLHGMADVIEQFKLDTSKNSGSKAEALLAAMEALKTEISHQKDASQHQISELESKNGVKEQQITEAARQNDVLSEKNAELERRCGALESRVAELVDGSYKLQAELVFANQTTADLLAQTQFTKERFGDLVESSATLKQRAKAIDALNVDLQSKLDLAEKKLAVVDRSVHSKEMVITDLGKKLAATTANVLALEEDHGIASSLMADVQNENIELKDNMALCEGRIAVLERLINSERSKNGELNRQSADLNRLNAALIAEQHAVSKHNAALLAKAENDREKLRGLECRNAVLESAAANSGDVTRLRKELESASNSVAALSIKVDELTKEKNVLSDQVPPAVPNDDLRTFLFFNVNTGDPVCSGSWAELTEYSQSNEHESPFLMAVEVSMLPGWRVHQVMNDRPACLQFIDVELQRIGNSADLPRLLSARFPTLADLVPETVKHLGAISFRELRRRELQQQRDTALEQRQGMAK